MAHRPATSLIAAACLSLALHAAAEADPAPFNLPNADTVARSSNSDSRDHTGELDRTKQPNELLVPAALPRSKPPEGSRGWQRSQLPERNAKLDELCPIIESEAQRNGLPPAFFARLIWTESRFNPEAVSPKGAQGIAQFMPGTAAERGLLDPFDPAEAIPHSALYLKELRDIFGNFGLAAAAYNAGPNRVARWLAGTSTLPEETEDYVYAITGRIAGDWSQNDYETKALSPQQANEFRAACRELGTLIAKRPSQTRRAVWQPWGVQLTAAFSQPTALASYSRIRVRFGSVLPAGEPMILHTRNLSRGFKAMHAVRVGAASRSDAQKICDRLRAAGGACVVVKN